MVLVDSITGRQQGCRVAKRELEGIHGEVVVSLSRCSRQRTCCIIIDAGVQERRFHQCQEARRRDGAGSEILGSTIVKDVALNLGVRHIKAGLQLRHDSDISVEADIQTIQTILLDGTFTIHVAQ